MKSLKSIKNRFIYILSASLLVVPLLLSFMTSTANAAALTNTYIRLDRMKANPQTTSFRLVFKAVSNQTANVAIDFDGADGGSAWTSNSGSVAASQTPSVASCPTETGAVALPGSITASGSGSVLTIASVGATATGTTYCVDLTGSALTNATAGEYHPTVTVGTDSTTVAIRTISNDQVSVNATVPPSFNFTLDTNTANFASNLSSSAVVQTNDVNVTITTNAINGWVVWAKDASTGLHSTTASNTIASTSPGGGSQTLSSGAEGYVLGAAVTTDSGAGVPSADAAFLGTSGDNDGGGLDTTFRTIASSTGTSAGDVVTLRGKASISGETKAASDYADTWTIIGAGTF